MEKGKKGLELLREPFKPNQISKLPKGTKKQNSCPFEEKRKCNICGGFHHPKIVHLDYVGHAALTDRLLDADINWHWEPIAFNSEGLPAFDASGGLWIRLHVFGQSRIGYGHAETSNYKEIGSREKEVIGDALRNAAMRFGAALDLWHKGDLHIIDDDSTPKSKPQKPTAQTINLDQSIAMKDMIVEKGIDLAAFLKRYKIKEIGELPTSKYSAANKAITGTVKK